MKTTSRLIAQLVITLLLALLTAPQARAVSTGCFIQDYSNYCYPFSFYASDCDQYNMTSYNFGNYIWSMCNYVNATEDAAASNAAYFNAAIVQRDSCLASAASTESNRQQWITYGVALKASLSKSQSLVSRLKKVCGTKCRKIK